MVLLWFFLFIILSLVPSFSFDLQLENWGVDVNALKAKTVNRVFRAWVEEWEKECIKDKDAVAEVGYWRSIRALHFLIQRIKSPTLLS